jgi:folylpolyglutamate synthase/dihydropteroate synthase
MLARKESDSFVGALAGVIDRIVAVPLPQIHVAPALITAQANGFGIDAGPAQSLAAAIQDAAQFSAPRVIICGSLALVAEALRAEQCA